MDKLNNDIWSEIFSYLDLKSIFTLERADIMFQQVLRSTRYWERMMEKEFSSCGFDISGIGEEERYFTIRRLYWTSYLLGHSCNFCKLCLIDDVCSNIPDCNLCDWINYLD